MDYIDDHVDRYRVEPICAQLPIAPFTYYAHKAREANVTKLSSRASRDAELEIGIIRVWDENFRAYAPTKSGTAQPEGMRSHAAR